MKVILLKEGIHDFNNEKEQDVISYIDPICSSVTLIKAETSEEKNILVDTGFNGFEDEILRALEEKGGLEAKDIEIVINTHEHFDHCENNYLFTNAKKIVGIMEWEPRKSIKVFKSLPALNLPEGVDIIATPGHKDPHFSVVVKADKTYVIAGDAIQKDFFFAPYESRKKLISAEKVLEIADEIIPGHGPVIKKEDFEPIKLKIKEIKEKIGGIYNV